MTPRGDAVTGRRRADAPEFAVWRAASDRYWSLRVLLRPRRRADVVAYAATHQLVLTDLWHDDSDALPYHGSWLVATLAGDLPAVVAARRWARDVWSRDAAREVRLTRSP